MTRTKSRLFFKNALLISVHSNKEPFISDVLVSQEGLISYVGREITEDAEDADRVIDATGKWLLPGFVSAHSHFWQSGFPGQASDKSVNEWSEAIYQPARNLTPQDIYTLTSQGAASHIRKGITTAFNFTYSPNFRDGLADRAQFIAALDSGIRFVHGFNVGAVTPRWSNEQALARTKKFLEWASTVDTSGKYLGTMIANHGIIYRTDSSIHMEAEVMQKLNLHGHLHYLESPRSQDIETEQSRWTWLRDAGLIDQRLIVGHFLHPTPSMLREAAHAGVRMSWNPMSNGRLGSGIADIPEYLKKGLCIGLGVDGEASSDRCDPFENMRMGLYSTRGKYQDPSVLTTREVLYMHTLGAAKVLGIDEKVGSLEIGKQADMVLLDPPSSWKLDDPVSTLVLSAGVEDIRAVFVGGVEQWPHMSTVHKDPTRLPELAWTFSSK
ncbi:Amidohydrolase 1 [Penicillium odoratum]|uniref:Amidohydrolase 1 n=1 Tax=Penicillium odoratum TaxID=1167516 RepID=UPI002547BFDA|nr:Amidohydrolase 1 [Penicillium odoratum]KAJ5765754.1 Amidohydrolase 1 [Penicillium odoratum]